MHSCCSPNTILVDGAAVCNDETIVIKDGSEIISGSDKEGQSYFIIIIVNFLISMVV